jgi:hypothetical protein
MQAQSSTTVDTFCGSPTTPAVNAEFAEIQTFSFKPITKATTRWEM